MSTREYEHAEVEVCPGGPLLVRGEQTVQTFDGDEYRTCGPLTALCRCGKSASAPLCDGTHKLLPPEKRP